MADKPPPRLWRSAVAGLATLLIVCGVTTFAFFFSVTPTRWYQTTATELVGFRNGLVLQYEFETNTTTGKTTPLLPGSLCFIVSHARARAQLRLGW